MEPVGAAISASLHMRPSLLCAVFAGSAASAVDGWRSTRSHLLTAPTRLSISYCNVILMS